MDTIDLLATELDDAYAVIRARVEGLTDAEFWWEPAPDCWTIRRKPNGMWAADYEVPDPEPAPLTTIGWRLVHVAECKLMYHEYAFGSGKLTWPEIDSARTPEAAIAQLEEGHALLVRDLQSMTNDTLEEPRMTNWGEEWPTWKVFWTMIQHDNHHGGEIGALRDLYRVTGVAGATDSTSS